MVLDLMAKIVRDLPVKLLTMATSFDQVSGSSLSLILPKLIYPCAQLIHLLSDVSSSVQQSAHQLLTRIVEQYVIDLIVEVELDSDAIRVIELPESLIRLLSKALKVDALESIDDYSDVRLSMLIFHRSRANPRLLGSGFYFSFRLVDCV